MSETSLDFVRECIVVAIHNNLEPKYWIKTLKRNTYSFSNSFSFNVYYYFTENHSLFVFFCHINIMIYDLALIQCMSVGFVSVIVCFALASIDFAKKAISFCFKLVCFVFETFC